MTQPFLFLKAESDKSLRVMIFPSGDFQDCDSSGTKNHQGFFTTGSLIMIPCPSYLEAGGEAISRLS